MKYINTSQLPKIAEALRPCFTQGKASTEDLRYVIEAMDEVAPEEIRNEAEWLSLGENKAYDFECSHCHIYMTDFKTNFCPCCGYIMKNADKDL